MRHICNFNASPSFLTSRRTQRHDSFDYPQENLERMTIHEETVFLRTEPSFFDKRKKTKTDVGVMHNITWGIYKALKGGITLIVDQSQLLFWTQSLWLLS